MDQINLLSVKNILYILLRTPSGIVCLCQWYILEEEWDWEAVLVAYCENTFVPWKDIKDKGLSLLRSQAVNQPALIFEKESFHSPLEGLLVHLRVTPQH